MCPRLRPSPMGVASTAHGLGARIGGGAIAAALTFVGPMLTGTGPQGAPVSSPGLSPFSTCASLRQWYVDHTIDQVGPYGWNGQMMFPEMEKAGVPAASPRAATDSVQNGPTGTNTQESGVDEPDVAKTDGRIVVRLEGRRVVITDVSGPAPRELATSTLPEGDYQGLLLVDGHVLVAGNAPAPRSYPAGYLPTARSVLDDLDVVGPLVATARLALDVVGHPALAAPVRRHGPSGHLDRAARARLRPARQGPRPGAGDRAQQGDRPREHDPAVAALGGRRRRRPPRHRLRQRVPLCRRGRRGRRVRCVLAPGPRRAGRTTSTPSACSPCTRATSPRCRRWA